MKKKLFYYLMSISIFFSICSCDPDDPKLNNPYNGKTTAVFNSKKKYGTLQDIDGNVYKTIKIGDQTWMAENLRVTHYQNGDVIPNIKDSTEWGSQIFGAYCNFNNIESVDTIATFGRLYNWYTTQDPRGLAPKGWRVANSVDWLKLVEYLGGDTIASKHMKEAGTKHWAGPNNADNSSGLTILPGDSRYRDHAFEYYYFNLYADFWTSSIGLYTTSAPFLFLTTFNDNMVYKEFNFKENGYSIRCIKEEE